MPPHLHPRSLTTSSLFGATLLVSFLVVGLPHIIPCPAPRGAYADVEVTPDGKRIRRTRPRSNSTDSKNKDNADTQQKMTPTEEAMIQALSEDKKARECPVPKPSGMLGKVLGFEQKK